ncbi:hypothetical protein PIB30_087243 [Stylosanthes scabra]|uniref:Uncharacterized protein n=1 Tax=Stylosanthes scabra TaxID=79078 RepID=A0ABU6USX5_9FABA|nr:hypothetical protein [Stylosanthes scabra]
MNKTPEEAWELIETVADANQHFNRRATSKGVYEVVPFNSTVLAKSLVDIAAMLKEIKEGQQVTPTLLKRQPDTSQQNPVKHCGICSPITLTSVHSFKKIIHYPHCPKGKSINEGSSEKDRGSALSSDRAAAKNCQPINRQPSGSSPTFKTTAVSTSSKPQGGINAVQVEVVEDEVEDEDDEND